MTSRYRCDALTNRARKPCTDVGSWSFVSCDEPVKNGCEIYEIFHVSLHILFKLKGFPNFAPFNSYPRKNDDYLLTWNAFRISDPSTLIPQKTMITPRHLRHTSVRMRNENEKMLIRIATYQSLLLQQIKCTTVISPVQSKPSNVLFCVCSLTVQVPEYNM